MGNRRKARELALQALFYVDMQRDDPHRMLDLYRKFFPVSKKTHPFFETLVQGVLSEKSRIDGIIERFSSNWKISRMPCVDRNVMRIAVFELLHCRDIPFKVSINEAIDVGKKFGSEDSGAFINGILDSIRVAITEGRISTPQAEVELEETP